MKNLILLLFCGIAPFVFAESLPQLDWAELAKTNPWAITEIEKDIPVVTPGHEGSAPSDAIVLFDGKNLSEWTTTPFGEGVRTDRTASFIQEFERNSDGQPAAWKVENGSFIAGSNKGAIATKRRFGDIQLHIEWRVPVLKGKSGQEYGNSGVFLMGLYELQVLNSYKNATYANGQAASIYKQHSPLVNASRSPGTWQAYDIIFAAPVFSEKGTVIRPAMLTVLHNGVLVQYNSVLQGPTAFIGEPYYIPHANKLPIVLQDHDNPVQFRNVWVREL